MAIYQHHPIHTPSHYTIHLPPYQPTPLILSTHHHCTSVFPWDYANRWLSRGEEEIVSICGTVSDRVVGTSPSYHIISVQFVSILVVQLQALTPIYSLTYSFTHSLLLARSLTNPFHIIMSHIISSHHAFHHVIASSIPHLTVR